MPVCSVQQFKEILPRICQRTTSYDPAGWSDKNPLHGHCAVVALLVQELFGGRIIKTSLSDHPEFANMRWHFFNRLPGGTVIDFTRPQFGRRYPKNLRGRYARRSDLLGNTDTRLRYNTLFLKLFRALNK